MIVAFDDELVADVTWVTNLFPGLFTSIHPALDCAIAGWITTPRVPRVHAQDRVRVHRCRGPADHRRARYRGA